MRTNWANTNNAFKWRNQLNSFGKVQPQGKGGGERASKGSVAKPPLGGWQGGDQDSTTHSRVEVELARQTGTCQGLAIILNTGPTKNFFSRWLRRDLNKEAIVLLTRHARTPSTWGHLWDFLHFVWSKQWLGQLDVTCGARFFISYFVQSGQLWDYSRTLYVFNILFFCVFCQYSNSFLFFVSPQGFLKRTRSWRRAKIFSTRRSGNFLSFRICFMHCVCTSVKECWGGFGRGGVQPEDAGEGGEGEEDHGEHR